MLLLLSRPRMSFHHQTTLLPITSLVGPLVQYFSDFAYESAGDPVKMQILINSSEVQSAPSWHHAGSITYQLHPLPNSDQHDWVSVSLPENRNSPFTSRVDVRLKLGKLYKVFCQCGRLQKWLQFSIPHKSRPFSWLAFKIVWKKSNLCVFQASPQGALLPCSLLQRSPALLFPSQRSSGQPVLRGRATEVTADA